MESMVLIESGRLFHMVGADLAKDLSPYLTVLAVGTQRERLFCERRVLAGSYTFNRSE